MTINHLQSQISFIQFVKLKEHGIDKINIIFCETDKEKAGLVEKNKVKIMIDDKHSILNKFLEDNLKIWICDDQKQIYGAIKSKHLGFVKLTRNRDDIMNIIIPKATEVEEVLLNLKLPCIVHLFRFFQLAKIFL